MFHIFILLSSHLFKLLLKVCDVYFNTYNSKVRILFVLLHGNFWNVKEGKKKYGIMVVMTLTFNAATYLFLYVK